MLITTLVKCPHLLIPLELFNISMRACTCADLNCIECRANQYTESITNALWTVILFQPGCDFKVKIIIKNSVSFLIFLFASLYREISNSHSLRIQVMLTASWWTFIVNFTGGCAIIRLVTLALC